MTMSDKSFLDGHTHLQMDEFSENREQMIESLRKEDVRAICNVGYDYDSSKAIMELEFPDDFEIYAFAGIHPHYAGKCKTDELDKITELLKAGNYNGIGEIGIDRYWYKKEENISIQKELFKSQLKIAEKLKIPVMLHIRDAYDEALDILEDYSLVNVEFHSFTGEKKYLEEIYRRVYFFGINGVITFKNSSLKEVLERKYIDKMIIETDAPYLTPVPFRGKRNRSEYVVYVYKFISDYFNIEMDELKEVVYNNFLRFINQRVYSE